MNAKLVKIWIATLAALIFYTKIDIMIWKRIFEDNQLWQYADMYHAGWIWALLGMITIGMIFIYPDIKSIFVYSVSALVVATCGLEDILYYWLDGRAIPAVLPWLENNPMIFKPVTSTNLILSAVFWLVMCAILGVDLLCQKSFTVSQAKYKTAK